MREYLLIGPIGSEGTETRKTADLLFHAIVERAAAKVNTNIRITRADKIVMPGDVNDQVIEKLLTAELVICDMTELNPNAFYELAVRHAMALPCVHLFPKGTRIPFDVSTMRGVSYSFDEIEASTDALQKAIIAAVSKNALVDNPVTSVVQRLAAYISEFRQRLHSMQERRPNNLFQLLDSAYSGLPDSSSIGYRELAPIERLVKGVVGKGGIKLTFVSAGLADWHDWETLLSIAGRHDVVLARTGEHRSNPYDRDFTCFVYFEALYAERQDFELFLSEFRTESHPEIKWKVSVLERDMIGGKKIFRA